MAPVELRLTLSEAQGVSLEETCFVLGDNKFIATRGTNSAYVGQKRGFVWSAASHAMLILLLKHAATYDLKEQDDGAFLEGEGGTPAAALDYALSNQPAWLTDIFGVLSDGTARARQLFPRLNPERKRGGAVRISVNTRILPQSAVQVIIGGDHISDPQKLSDLAQIVERQWFELHSRASRAALKDRKIIPLVPHQSRNKGQLTTNLSPAARFDGANLIQTSIEGRIFSGYLQEASSMLSETSIFTPLGKSRLHNGVIAHPLLKKLAGDARFCLSALDDDLIGAERLGQPADYEFLLDSLRDGPPIHIAVSPAHVGTLVILQLLKSNYRLPIKVNFHFAHSVEMARRMIGDNFSEPPDICSLTIATAGTVLGKQIGSRYQPLMLMPRMTHGIVVTLASQKASITTGEYLFMNDIPGTEAFMFDDMRRRAHLSLSRVKTKNAEPDEVGHRLGEGDSEMRAIIGFPHYLFQIIFNNCCLLNTPHNSDSALETLFFARPEFACNHKRSRAFRVAVRDAWFGLHENPVLLQDTLRTFLSNPEYLKLMRRLAGTSRSQSFSQVDPGIINNVRNL